MDKIIKVINEKMELKGVSKAELARKTGITQQTLLNFLKHGRNITVINLVAICDVLDLTLTIR